MLSPQTIATIKATVPVLQTHGETLTRHFYAIMFRDHPEVRPFFNPAHQASGTQQRALAASVLAYAQHIDRLEALAGAVPTIVHKHVSLGVRPEHYPIVGQCLLQAIREVLGEAATPEIIDAWAQAYGALAQLLIGAEDAVYQANATRAGGWRGTRAFRVARREVESEVIASFYLEPVDGGAVPDFQPGQYLTVLATIDGSSMRRNYSLSNAPGQPWLRISVKREAGGVFSNWLHEQASVGSVLELMPPCGEFVLDARRTDAGLVFVVGGVGITPVMSMLESTMASTVTSGRPITLIHAARNSAVQAFRRRLDELAAQHPTLTLHHLYDQPLPGDQPDATGLIDAERLAAWLPPQDSDYDLYCLGPKPFMQAVHRATRQLGLAPERTHWEFFGPSENLDQAA
jgi:nitric oxide dioxygenase